MTDVIAEASIESVFRHYRSYWIQFIHIRKYEFFMFAIPAKRYAIKTNASELNVMRASGHAEGERNEE